jgi:hypothetical protein
MKIYKTSLIMDIWWYPDSTSDPPGLGAVTLMGIASCFMQNLVMDRRDSTGVLFSF